MPYTLNSATGSGQVKYMATPFFDLWTRMQKMAHARSRGNFDFLADPTPLGKYLWEQTRHVL